MLTYPKRIFSKKHISAPRGCCAPKFLHALENDQVLVAHPPPGTGAPLESGHLVFVVHVVYFECYAVADDSKAVSRELQNLYLSCRICLISQNFVKFTIE